MVVKIRPIAGADNAALAIIIRNIFDELELPKTGSAYADRDTDQLFELFERSNGSCYFVAGENGDIHGGCGVFPTPKLPPGYAELVKLYLAPASRGRGTGRALVEKCITAARRMKYTHLYLETFPEMTDAIRLYEKMGWVRINHSLGDSGHFSCTEWFVKQL